MKTGICSITFRSLTPVDLIALTRRAGLDAIEWGGDLHVLPGEPATAAEVGRMTRDAGLEVSSYGSYYKVVDAEGRPLPFSPVLESAQALGTDTIRIWAGNRPSDAVDAAERERIVATLRSALDAAQEQGVRLALEFHANTLSDSNAATLALLEEVDHPNLFTYWQPVYWLTDTAYRLEGLKRLVDRVLNLHVFHWQFHPGRGTWGDSTDRRPLEEGGAEWARYLEVPLNPGYDHYALMEFVRNDDPAQFLQDAAVLKRWLSEMPADVR